VYNKKIMIYTNPHQEEINRLYAKYPIRGGLLVFLAVFGLVSVFSDIFSHYNITTTFFTNTYFQYITAIAVSAITVIVNKIRHGHAAE